MSILDFFKNNKNNSVMESVVAPKLSQVSNEVNNDSETPKQTDENVRIIKFVTGRAIDVVYDFINKDNEEQGYRDAIVVSDTSYRDQRVNVIKNTLNSLIRQVNLRYKDDIRKIEVNIKSAQEVFALTTVSNLESEKAIIEEHQEELKEIEEKLKSDDPSVSMMIDSYKRGFMKGVAAQANGFLQK